MRFCRELELGKHRPIENSAPRARRRTRGSRRDEPGERLRVRARRVDGGEPEDFGRGSGPFEAQERGACSEGRFLLVFSFSLLGVGPFLVFVCSAFGFGCGDGGGLCLVLGW